MLMPTGTTFHWRWTSKTWMDTCWHDLAFSSRSISLLSGSFARQSSFFFLSHGCFCFYLESLWCSPCWACLVFAVHGGIVVLFIYFSRMQWSAQKGTEEEEKTTDFVVHVVFVVLCTVHVVKPWQKGKGTLPNCIWSAAHLNCYSVYVTEVTIWLPSFLFVFFFSFLVEEYMCVYREERRDLAASPKEAAWQNT